MKRLLILSIGFLLGCGLWARNVDSLLSITDDEQAPDFTRGDALYELAVHYLYSSPDSALYFAERGLELATASGRPALVARALVMKGKALWMKQEYVLAMDPFLESYKLYESEGDLEGMTDVLNNIGNVYYMQGDYPGALRYYLRANRFADKLEDASMRARAFFNISVIYAVTGEHEKALEYMEEALGRYQELGDESRIAALYNNMGNTYRARGELELSLEKFREAYRIQSGHHNLAEGAITLTNIGTSHVELEQYEDAEKYFKMALDTYLSLGNKEGCSAVQRALGEMHRLKGNLREAESFCRGSLELALSLEMVPEQLEAHECLYTVYKDMGQSERALEHYELFSALQDSFKNAETRDMLARMEFQDQMLADSMERVGQDIARELAHRQEVLKQKNRKNTYMLGGIGMLILAVSLLGRVRYVQKAREDISREKARSDHLLLNILPAEVAEELKSKGEAAANEFDKVTVLFSDFVDFTEVSEKLNPKQLVEELNVCFKAFDEIAGKYGIEKIKTIGDAYMAAGGLPVSSPESVARTIHAALEMQAFMRSRMETLQAVGKRTFTMRIGLHTGTVVAGIVGLKKFQYDIWGDTVNTASRMETAGQAGRVNISQATWELVKDDPDFSFEKRGSVFVKGKGEMEMYFVQLKGES